MDDLDLEISDEAFEAANRRGEEERARSAIPRSVRFDSTSGRIVVEFTNDAAFMVPARSLQGLEDASDDELAEVELLGETGVHWETRDVDYRIAGLMAGIFGTAKFMESARRGGQSRSEAKQAASRANGAKGGRPRRLYAVVPTLVVEKPVQKPKRNYFVSRDARSGRFGMKPEPAREEQAPMPLAAKHKDAPKGTR